MHRECGQGVDLSGEDPPHLVPIQTAPGRRRRGRFPPKISQLFGPISVKASFVCAQAAQDNQCVARSSRNSCLGARRHPPVARQNSTEPYGVAGEGGDAVRDPRPLRNRVNLLGLPISRGWFPPAFWERVSFSPRGENPWPPDTKPRAAVIPSIISSSERFPAGRCGGGSFPVRLNSANALAHCFVWRRV